LNTAHLLNWRIYVRLLRYLLGTALLLVVLIAASGSTPGLHIAAQIIHRVSAGQVSIDGITGSLFNGLHIKHIQFVSPTKTITLQQLNYSWSAKSAWQHQRLDIEQFSINRLEILLKKPDNQPLTLPNSLTLPFAVSLRQAHISTFIIQGNGVAITLQPVTFDLLYDRKSYQLQAQAKSPWGSAQLHAALADLAPFKLSSDIQFGLHDGIHAYDARSQLTGTLSHIALNSQAQSGKASATINAQLAPFASQPLTQARLNVSNFNPAAIADGLPQAMIDGRADISPSDANNYTGSITLNNQLTGSLDQNKLPISQLATRFSGSPSAVIFDKLALTLGKSSTIYGTGKWHDNGLDLQLDARQIDLHALHTRLYSTRLNGKLAAHADAKQQTLHATLAQPDYAINLDATYQQQRLNITTAQLSSGTSALNFTGALSFTGNHPFSASGQLKRFDPAKFGNYPTANINADFNTKGQIQPQLQTQLQLNIIHSTYNHAALSGHATMQIAQKRMHNSIVQLQLGNNILNWQGSYGAVNDHINWQLNAPNIANLGDGYAGKVLAHGTLGGTLANPAGELSLRGDNLHWRSALSLASINTHINFASGADGAIQANAEIQDMHMSNNHIQHATMTVRGTRHHHTIQLTAKNPELNLIATLAGNWHDQSWDGHINQLSNSTSYPFSLNGPAQLAIHSDQTQLNHAQFHIANGTLNIDQIEYSKSGLSSRGSASHIDLGELQQHIHPVRNLHNTLIVGGKWLARVDQQLNGELELWREQGDISVTGDQITPMRLDRTHIALQAQHNQITAKVDIHGATLGSINVQASTALAQNAHQLIFTTHAPITGHAQIDLPTLDWITASLSDEMQLNGSLQAQVDLRGSLYAPIFNGVINASKLTFSHSAQGINLKNGTLNAAFDQNVLHIKQLHFQAGGELNVQGDIKLNQGVAELKLQAQAMRLDLVNRPDRQITLTGTADITGKNQRITTVADITIDHAALGLNDNSVPQLSNDVVIIGRTPAPNKTSKSASQPASAWQVNSDIKVNLGKRTQIRGSGLDARLEGTLKLAQHGNNPPAANGTITIAEGTYTAFGQRLNINRGILNFAGPINNPGLDILAIRTYPDVTVGTQITGTALTPVAKLVSTPSMTDSEKLSWLVLGHGSDKGSSGADIRALQAAASYYLGKNNSVSMQSRLTQLTGLDEIGINGTGTLDSNMLSLGKRISDQVYINYQQGLTGTKQLVRITYNISRRFSIRAQSGDESALDFFYTFRFD